jgi:hypothetical protein
MFQTKLKLTPGAKIMAAIAIILITAAILQFNVKYETVLDTNNSVKNGGKLDVAGEVQPPLLVPEIKPDKNSVSDKDTASPPKTLRIHKEFEGHVDMLNKVVMKPANQAELESDWMRTIISNELGETPRNHRKQWELAHIVNIVKTYNLCESGKSGMVFAVG